MGVRWVDTWKKDGVRSRLVCQDFKQGKGQCDEMFAPTPPLLASRWLCSRMASQAKSGLQDGRLMALDFSKAFLYGDVEGEVFIELPEEDARRCGGANVGLLSKSMYGLRDAPLIWQKVVKVMLMKRGFIPLIGTQCVDTNKKLKMTIVAHVDDLLCQGEEKDLKDLLNQLQGE